MQHTPRILLTASLALTHCTSEPSESPESPEVMSQAFPACDREFTVGEADPMLVWTPNAVRLVSERLAPGVFAIYDEKSAEYGPAGIPLATSGGFVIGDAGVVMVESMINRQLFCQAIALIQAETDLPIRYVINTSSHGDHSFGNTFLPADVEIVQHERTAEFISEHFAADVEFMTANFGTKSGLEELEPVPADILVGDDGWTVDLGGVTVEARYYGFGQTDGDLFVWVPSARVLWTGNPLIAEAPAIPWLLDGHGVAVEETLQRVQASLPADATIVPGHGRPIDVGSMDFSIDYLNTLITVVTDAIADGRTVEEAAEAEALAPFQGYAIWGWVHSQVNIPNTYAELSE